MTRNGKFILKIVLIILAIGLGIFLFQTGKFYYKIKTGNIASDFFTQKFSRASTVEEDEIELDSNKIVDYASVYFGTNSPELTIVEFGNFLCPYSSQVASTMRELMLAYKDKIKFLYRDYPLDDIYPNSSLLALAGKCANEQGVFWGFFDKIIYSKTSDPVDIAVQAGANKERLTNCIQNQDYVAQILDDLKDGYESGVTGTPTFFFIKKGHEDKPIKIEGAIPKDVFEKAIKQLLEN